MHTELITARQESLSDQYATEPKDAWIVDSAYSISEGHDAADGLHTRIVLGPHHDGELTIGVHRAVGGDHDTPNPGDLLCAALCGCLEMTIRMIAARMNVPLRELRCQATAEVDVRGTLCIDPEVPVNFQKMCVRVEVTGGPGVKTAALRRLLGASEYCCVTMQTLKKGIPVETDFVCHGVD